MTAEAQLEQFAEDIAGVIERVDAETEGQYGDGLGSEDEERQVDLLLEALQETTSRYRETQREVRYPNRSERCDLLLPENIPVEAKLLRYWRANGDLEDYMYTHVFSPFHGNTLMTDAKTLHESNFESPGGLLGLFYARGAEDSASVRANPDLFTAENLAQKVVEDIDYWYDFDAEVCAIAHFDGLQHTIQRRGAVITWSIE
jgi:hypothetical protein